MSIIHQISSSEFVQSGSKANFKSGITSSGLSSKGAIYAQGFKNLGLASSNIQPLTVGTQSADGSFDECVTFINTPFRLTASGSFNHFTFIEKRSDGWFQISSGSQNGLIRKDFVDIDGKSTSGIFEYLVLAMSTSSLKTVVKGTTVTVKES
jgi:hypothetical protein